MRIELRDVSLAYGAGEPVLRDISLEVESGAFVLIEGPSGSGKSSLLRLLNRLQDPTAGRILVDGRPLEELPVPSLRRRVGYVPQTPVMLEATTEENLRLPFRFRAAAGATEPGADRLRALLDELLLRDVGLADDASRLSVGQKQRLALIRTLLTEPRVLLCDEPTSALDPDSRDIVQSCLERLNREQGITVVVVTHLELRPRDVAARRYRLVRGEALREIAA